MTILELFFALSVNDFAVPEHKEIVDTAESVQACRDDPDVHAECKNIIKQLPWNEREDR